MTNAEAIELLRGRKIILPSTSMGFVGDEIEYVRSVNKATDMAIAALEKQEGKKPVYNGVNCECPFCNTTIETDMKPWYCDICGQRIEWGDECGNGR